MVRKIFFFSTLIIVVGAVIFFAIDGSAKKDEGNKTFPVEKGSIIDKALAVGEIEPKLEVEVKSKIPGIVRKIFVEIGDQVRAGDPLIEIAPDPTPIEFAEAKRQVEIQQVGFANAKLEYDRVKQLRDKQLISHQEYDSKKAVYDEAKLRLELAEEKLSLIESGKSTVANRVVDNVIRASINGTVLSRSIEEGDPVVPLTSYQAGTELMTLAKMEDLVFKGNVDEIDVGKLTEGMEVEIEIGALPNEKLVGRLKKISPKAHRQEGSIVFDVEIELEEASSKFLRAGYSANADIIITKKVDILLIPERLITFNEDSAATVEVQDSLNITTTKTIKTGLSDGLKIEVLEGLSEGEQLVERPPKEITAD